MYWSWPRGLVVPLVVAMMCASCVGSSDPNPAAAHPDDTRGVSPTPVPTVPADGERVGTVPSLAPAPIAAQPSLEQRAFDAVDDQVEAEGFLGNTAKLSNVAARHGFLGLADDGVVLVALEHRGLDGSGPLVELYTYEISTGDSQQLGSPMWFGGPNTILPAGAEASAVFDDYPFFLSRWTTGNTNDCIVLTTYLHESPDAVRLGSVSEVFSQQNRNGNDGYAPCRVPSISSVTNAAGSPRFLPDPFLEDARFPCGHLPSTPELAACSEYAWFHADAALRVTVELLDRRVPDLRAQQEIWRDDLIAVCELSRGGGSIDRLNVPACLAAGARNRNELLRVSFDLGQDVPTGVNSIWGAPSVDFVVACEQGFRGTISGAPVGGTLIREESSVQFSSERFGPIVGSVESETVLLVDGREYAVTGAAHLWGTRSSSLAAGVYREAGTFDGEDATSWGYWWFRVDDTTGIGTGEMINMFERDAFSVLSISATGCSD